MHSTRNEIDNCHRWVHDVQMLVDSDERLAHLQCIHWNAQTVNPIHGTAAAVHILLVDCSSRCCTTPEEEVEDLKGTQCQDYIHMSFLQGVTPLCQLYVCKSSSLEGGEVDTTVLLNFRLRFCGLG